MWLFSTSGFLSVVAYDASRAASAEPLPNGVDTQDMLLIRARVEEDLTAVLVALELPSSRAVSTPGADYPHRAVFSREEWTRYVAYETGRVDYPNFKERVAEVQGQARHDAYLRVWSILKGLGPWQSVEGPETGGDSALW